MHVEDQSQVYQNLTIGSRIYNNTYASSQTIQTPIPPHGQIQQLSQINSKLTCILPFVSYLRLYFHFTFMEIKVLLYKCCDEQYNPYMDITLHLHHKTMPLSHETQPKHRNHHHHHLPRENHTLYHPKLQPTTHGIYFLPRPQPCQHNPTKFVYVFFNTQNIKHWWTLKKTPNGMSHPLSSQQASKKVSTWTILPSYLNNFILLTPIHTCMQ